MTRTIAATALCAVAAIGCSRADEPSQPAAPPLDVRRDAAGLTAVFPAIGVPESVAWVQWSGSAGGDTTARWTDAVVHLAPAVADAMVQQFEPTDTGRKPQVQDELSADIPKGPFLTGDRLDDGFSSVATSAYAFLDREHATLVLQATSLD
ncbi:MAG: hypothetical protein HYZ39_06115 [Mycolicibacterium cosmeticum]|nr:hypothetical protein [Mycolicibacterium cosmeticum]